MNAHLSSSQNLDVGSITISSLLSYLLLNSFHAEEAIFCLSKCSSRGTPIDKALANYKKATNTDNDFLTPYYLNKLGVLNMKQGNNDAALQNYKKIEADYPQSAEAKDAKKYISLLKTTS